MAKLAQKGKGRQIRFQGGTLFPAAVLIIGVLGALLIFYARGSRPDHNSPPTVNDHWHVSYGFYACDQWLPNLTGALEDAGTAGNQKYLASGVHSHDDGVIHWHAFTSKATGTNAKLGVFLDNYGIELTEDKLQFPADQNGGATYEEGETKCTVDGQEKDGVLKVVVYDPYNDESSAQTYITDFDDIVIKNSTAISIVFAPKDTNAGRPLQADQLPQLGAIDSNQSVPPEVTTPDGGTATVAPSPEQSTVPGETTVPADSTVPGDSTVPAESTTAPDSTTATSAPTTSAAASSTTTG